MDLNEESIRIFEVIAQAQDAIRLNEPPWLSDEVIGALIGPARVVAVALGARR